MYLSLLLNVGSISLWHVVAQLYCWFGEDKVYWQFSICTAISPTPVPTDPMTKIQEPGTKGKNGNLPAIFNIKFLSHFITTGIEIMLTRSPMATGFCFGRAENLENYSFFARILICTLKSVLSAFGWNCLWFCCDVWGKRYVNRRISFGMKRWRGVHDGEIKTKSSVCLLLHVHTWGHRSWHTLQLVIGVLLQ